MIAVQISRVSYISFDDDYIVHFPYDANIVSLVKELPRSSRKWDPARKQWIVTGYIHAHHLAATLQFFGYPVVSNVPEFNTRKQQDPPKPPPAKEPAGDWAEQLLRTVGPDRIDAVYKALARVLHPDTATGDPLLMRDLNAARDRQAVAR